MLQCFQDLQVAERIAMSFQHVCMMLRAKLFPFRRCVMWRSDCWMDQGSLMVLKERVAVSPHVTQPILCFGRLLQSGWSMDSSFGP